MDGLLVLLGLLLGIVHGLVCGRWTISLISRHPSQAAVYSVLSDLTILALAACAAPDLWLGAAAVILGSSFGSALAAHHQPGRPS